MKLLVLTFYFRPDLSAGSFRMAALVDALTRQYPEAEVDVITTIPNRYNSFSVDAPPKEVRGNVRITRLLIPEHKSGMADQIRSFGSFFSQVRKIVKNEEYDLVFATSSRLFTAFMGASIARKKNVPLFLDIRDIFRDSIGDVLGGLYKSVLNPTLAAIENYTFSRAEHVNLVSRGFQAYFESRFKGPTYSYHTNGIDPAFLFDEEIILASNDREQDSSTPKRLLYAGNIGEGQGLHIVVPKLAAELHGEIQIEIIGDGGKRAALEAASAELSNVTLHPPVARGDLPEIYQRADVLFMHLNDYSAFEKVLPSKLFEYAASGKPILAGVSGYAAEFVRENIENAAIFAPNDVRAAVTAYRELSLESVYRGSFLAKYERAGISAKLAHDIVALSSAR